MPRFAEDRNRFAKVCIVAAFAGIAAVLGTMRAHAAHAADICGDGLATHAHCYAAVPWASGGRTWFTGAEATAARVSCMAVNNAGGWGLNQTLWVGGGPAGQPYRSWVEAGLAQGDPLPGGSRFAYWAATTTDGNYDEHDTDEAWAAGGSYDIQIRETAPSTGVWRVRIDGPAMDVTAATAGQQSTRSYRIETGLESRDSANADASVANGLRYVDASANGHVGWSRRGEHADRGGDLAGNTAGSWLVSYRSWRSNQEGEC